jgi:hypothetical protein
MSKKYRILLSIVSLPEVADTGHRRGDYSTTEMPNTGQRGQKSAEPIVRIQCGRNGQSERRRFLSAKLGGCKRGNTERANGIPCRTMDERRKGGISDPPCMADAKAEMPDERTR